MMERRIGLAALDVEKYSKIGTQDLQTGQLDQALEAFKYAYKRSHELDDGFTERACAFNLGAAYIAMGQPKRGLEVLQKAVPPENKKEGKSNGDLYFNFGLGYEGLGNYEDAARNYTKALEEYKAEGDNLEMEAETLEKLAHIYSQRKNAFAADAYSQLVQVYEHSNNPANYLKQMKALFQKASHLYQGGRKEDAESAADDCIKIAEKCGANIDVGNILNDLGLVYTQLQKYDRALTCFEQALPMIRIQGDKKQEAVLLQNLGATYNFLGDYQRAVGFHESAAKLYADLKNRNSQGQCFANLAFAFSQLKDPESAGEAFLHAFQAAKDTGDKRTQWQVTEGLGAVAFNKGQVNKAIAYFKQALSILSTCDPNTAAQDRIVGKLTHALKVQVAQQSGKQPSQHVKKPIFEEKAVVKSTSVSKAAVTEKSQEAGSGKDVVKYGRGERFIPVSRRGSSKRFKKVARGISTPSLTGTSSLRQSMLSPSDESSSETLEGSSGESDDSEESDIEETKKEYLRKIRSGSGTNRKLDLGIQEESEDDTEESGSEEEEEEETEGDEDTEEEVNEKHENEEDEEKAQRKAVEAEMRKFSLAADDESEDEESEDSEKDDDREKEIDEQTGVKRPLSPKVNVETASKKDSDSETETDQPPAPTQSPLPTSALVRTYDDPLPIQEVSAGKDRRTKYADIDFQTPVGTSGMTSHRRNTDQNLHDHPNYFDSDSEEDIKSRKDKEGDKNFSESKILTDENLAPSPEQSENDPVYQSIRTGERTLNDAGDAQPQEQPDFSTFANLPRGENESRAEQERRLYEEHQKYRQRQSEIPPPLPERKGDQKPSKACVVM